MIAPVSEGVHWFIASCIALIAHVMGLLWIGLDSPPRDVGPDPYSEQIVVRLDPGSAADMESVTLMHDPRDRAAHVPSPNAGDDIRQVDEVPPVSDAALDSVEPDVADPDAAASVVPEPAPPTAQTRETAPSISDVSEARAHLGYPGADAARSVTPVTLVEQSNQAAVADPVPSRPVSPVAAAAETATRIASPAEAQTRTPSASEGVAPNAVAPATAHPEAGAPVEIAATTPITSVAAIPDYPAPEAPGPSTATALEVIAGHPEPSTTVEVDASTAVASVTVIPDFPAPEAPGPSAAVLEVSPADSEPGKPVEVEATTVSPDDPAPAVATPDALAPAAAAPDAVAPAAALPEPPSLAASEPVLADVIEIEVESAAPAPSQQELSPVGVLEPAAAVTVAQNVQDTTPVSVMDEVTAVETVNTPAQSAPADTARPPEVAVVEVPEEQLVARVYTLDELQRQSPGGRGVVAGYAGRLKGWLEEHMHYPRAARLAGIEGRAVVRFAIDRQGTVLSIQLEQESGQRILDTEAMEMIERANPFPPMPAEMTGEALNLRVPIAFKVKDASKVKHIPPIDLQ